MTTKTNITLPPLPEWSKMDDLGGLVPSEVRVALAGYARSAVEADRLKKEDYINDDRNMLRAEIVALKGTIADFEADRQGRMPSDELRGTSDPIAGLPRAQSVSDEMMDLVDRLGSEYDEVDPRAWEHLLVYAPRLSRYGSSQPEAGKTVLVENQDVAGQPAASAEPETICPACSGSGEGGVVNNGIRDEQAICETCGGSGVIGGPSYYEPGNGGEPCPDCTTPVAQEPVKVPVPDIPVGCEMTRNWSVTVCAEGADILTISSEHVAGVSDLESWCSTIRGCAQHLLSFVGDAAPVAQEPPQVTDAEIEQIVTGAGARWDGSVWKVEDADLHPMARALLYRYTTAPVAAQPSAQGETVYRSADILKAFNNGFDLGLRHRTSQDRKDDSTLADTQRAIIEAAEQRGYVRALAECGQDHENAKRYTWLRDHPPKDCQGGMRVRIWGESGAWTSISGEKLDAAIDAAWAANGADHG